jgi:hypothetical protein
LRISIEDLVVPDSFVCLFSNYFLIQLVREYIYPGATKQAIDYPFVLNALATFEYFEMKHGFSIFGLLKSPMVLMMVVSAGLMFLMPKMLDSLDPEEKARMKKQMANQQDPAKMFSALLSEFTGGEPEEPKAVPKKIKK